MRLVFLALLALTLFAPSSFAGNYYNAGMPETAQADDTQEEDASALPGLLPQAEEPPPPSGRHVVTPVAGCLDRLPEEEAAEIRATSITPYEDCQKRLHVYLKEKKLAREKKKAVDEEAETPANYARVTETADESEDAEEEDEKLRRKSAKKHP